MGITLNYVTVDPAENKDDWEVIGDAEGLEDSNYPPKQGSQCVGWELQPNKVGGIRNVNPTEGFDIRTQQVGLWFLNPVVDVNKNLVIKADEDGLVLRLYSGDDWAEYYQPRHRKANGEWKGGWLHLTGSGAPGDEDVNSGTWGTEQVSAVDRVAVMVKSGDGDTTDKDSGNFGTDWSKYYDKVIITGDNDGNPWTLQDVYTTDVEKSEGDGVWGVIRKTVDFYEFDCGITFGDGTDGTFAMDNEYVLLEQLNLTQKYPITVTESFTLKMGIEDVGAKTYAKNGVNITSVGEADFTVENGATVSILDSKIQGFALVQLGQGEATPIKVIGSDLYNNGKVVVDSPDVSLVDNRVYFSSGVLGTAGDIDTAPVELRDTQVFNASTGFNVKVDMSIVGYNATNNTYDLAVKEGVQVTLNNSFMDATKIKHT